ncbi:MAG: TetR/AcrR family transcriptional regulator, partial [Actinomycetales bacterium]
ILRSIVTVVRARGFAGTRVADIAIEAGTSPGLILYHFKSLDGALNAALTLLEDEFYEDLERDLREQLGPVERLRHMAELAAGMGPAVGDWRLWLELWVRALHDPGAAAVRASLDRRWRSVLREVITEGAAVGDFRPVDPDGAVIRLASLMDGLAIQLALDDEEMTPERLAGLWWQAAVLELGLDIRSPVPQG